MNESVAKTSLPTQSQGAWFLRAEGAVLLVGNSMMISLACIWCAHIGMDRLVGYDFREASSRGSTIREAYATQSK